MFEVLEDALIEGTPLTGGPIISAVVSFTQNVIAAVSSWGYYGVFLLMLLESSSLPIPSEVVLPLAGYMVSMGQLNVWVTIAVATVAGVAGSLIDYYIGLKGVRYLAEHRVLGKVFFTRSQLEVAVRWFGKYGAIIVLLSRLIPGFRTIVSFPAGAVKMPLAKFVAYTTMGCLIWNGILIHVGMFLGKRWREVAGVSHYIIYGTVAAVIALLVVFLVRRRRRTTRSE